MARKPNYRFERSERDRLKAQKKAERAARKGVRSGDEDAPEGEAASNTSGETGSDFPAFPNTSPEDPKPTE